MITSTLTVSLIEVNTNPCLSTLSEEQNRLISRLIDDTLKVGVDPFIMGKRDGKDGECGYEMIWMEIV